VPVNSLVASSATKLGTLPGIADERDGLSINHLRRLRDRFVARAAKNRWDLPAASAVRHACVAAPAPKSAI
jgi:hypothetical protein